MVEWIPVPRAMCRNSGSQGAWEYFCPLMMWMIDAIPARPLFLLALHFGDFQRRKSEIHCADDAVHLL